MHDQAIAFKTHNKERLHTLHNEEGSSLKAHIAEFSKITFNLENIVKF